MKDYNAVFSVLRNIYIKSRIVPWLIRKTMIYPVLKNNIQFHLKSKRDTYKLSQLLDRSNPLTDPLKLPFESIQEIKTSLEPELFHYNPTIICKENTIKIFWRISNINIGPYWNWHGLIEKYVPAGKRIEGTGYGEITLNQNGKIEIRNEKVLISPSQNNWTNQIDQAPSEKLLVEDPRVVESGGTYLLFNSWKINEADNEGTHGPMVLFALENSRMIQLKDYTNKGIHKNSVIVNMENRVIRLLKSSNPQIIQEYDVSTGDLTSAKTKLNNDKLFLNGGSPFILVDDTFYIRIARQRYTLKNLFNVHVSLLVIHDLNFDEIARTKPFILQNYGFEVCNGFILEGDKFIFSWGENNKRMFLGTVSKTTLLEFFHANKGK